MSVVADAPSFYFGCLPVVGQFEGLWSCGGCPVHKNIPVDLSGCLERPLGYSWWSAGGQVVFVLTFRCLRRDVVKSNQLEVEALAVTTRYKVGRYGAQRLIM